MRSVLIFCISIFLINAFGQQVRYVDGFKRTVDEEKATYHQVIYTDSLLSNSVLIKMFDKSGLLIDAGYYDKSDLSIKMALLLSIMRMAKSIIFAHTRIIKGMVNLPGITLQGR